MTGARRASGKSTTRGSPSARARRHPLDRVDREFERPSTRPTRRSEQAPAPAPVLASKPARVFPSLNVGKFGHQGIYVRVGIVCGTAALVFVLFAALGAWLLSAPTGSVRDDAPVAKTAQEAAKSTQTVKTLTFQRPDTDRSADSASPRTSLPEQKPSVAVVIPRGAPPSEQMP